MSLYKSFGKRAFDIAAASLALILLSPLIGALVLAVGVKLGRPVLFRQQRTGWQRRPFHILKLRSMLDSVDDQGRMLPDEKRLIPFGHWLRAWSLDELPGLLNILKGDMSLIGPRPLIHQYDELYSPEQARRFLVRPGITGWAQVNGRNSLSWPEKFALDIWYVDNLSFWLDLKILLLTVRGVLRRHGINAADAATMPPFRGER
jgi:sugar transferase EpsL